MVADHFSSDTVISKDDRYSDKVCKRCMVFMLDLILQEYQYSKFDHGVRIPKYRNAINQFLNLCASCPTAARNEPAHEDVNRARHVDLKVSAPRGP